MKRDIKIYYATGTACEYGIRSCAGAKKPMLRISNRFLLQSGFAVGDKAEVEYGNGVLIIRKASNV